MVTKQYVIDLEANGLLDTVDKIWCIVIKEFQKDNWYYYINNPIGTIGLDVMTEMARNDPKGDRCILTQDSACNLLGKRPDLRNSEIIGHNIIEYDIPCIEKVIGYKCKLPLIDTLVMSRCLNPDREGGHSLESWLKRLNGTNQKVQNKDWDKWDPILLERCKSDVQGTEDLYIELLKEMK